MSAPQEPTHADDTGAAPASATTATGTGASHSNRTSATAASLLTSSPLSSFSPVALPLTVSPSSSLNADDERAGTGSTTVRAADASSSGPARRAHTIVVPPRSVSPEGPPPPTPAKERSSMYSPGPIDARPTSHYSQPQSPLSPQFSGDAQTSAALSRKPTGINEPRPSYTRRQSQVDWIVPTTVARDTVARRLGFTVDIAKRRHASLESYARLIGRALNAAIGLQVVVGALITGLASVTEGKQTSIMTSILGAVSIIIGAFLARMRGTAEPDLSKSRAKGWDKFLRSTEAYLVDHGDELARDHITRIEEFRQEFEDLAGSANAEQKGNNV